MIYNTVLAILALGLAKDAAALAVAPAYCTNSCGVAVKLAPDAKKDCSAHLIKTIIPIVTTTVYVTQVNSAYNTAFEQVTESTDITVTATASETEYTSETFTATVEETTITTNYYTAFDYVTSTTTIPYSRPGNKKRSEGCLVPVPNPRPAYASECNGLGYTQACSCLGVAPSTVSKAPITSTVSKTYTAYQTVSHTAVNTASVTHTNLETTTSFTTIVESLDVTETQTVSTTTTETSSVTSVSVVTETAEPVPPTCRGNGFKFFINAPGTSIHNWGIGLINEIGNSPDSGVYFRLFSGGASPFQTDTTSDGSMAPWYSPSLYPSIVVKEGPPPYRLRYTAGFATQQVKCFVGEAPDYSLYCTLGGNNYAIALCQSPVYYDWYPYMYSETSQLSSLGNCVAVSNMAKAVCV